MNELASVDMALCSWDDVAHSLSDVDVIDSSLVVLYAILE